jgi:hypothetical protein
MGADRVVVGEYGDVPGQSFGERQKIRAHLVELSETTPCVLHEHLARRRQRDASRMPAQQRHAYRVFKILHAKARGRWRKVAAFSAARDVALFGDGDEHLQVSQVIAHRVRISRR